MDKHTDSRCAIVRESFAKLDKRDGESSPWNFACNTSQVSQILFIGIYLVEGIIVIMHRGHTVDWSGFNLGMLLIDGDIVRNSSGLGFLCQVDRVGGVHLGVFRTRTLIARFKGKCSPFKDAK